MNRLLLDLGNTRLKWALAELDVRGVARLGSVQALAHGGPDFLPALQHQLRSLPPLASAHLVAVTSESLAEAVIRCVEASVDLVDGGVIRARTAARAGRLVCAYADPSRLGTDRWLSLRGALRLLPAPLLAVSAGTALTVDAIGADGRHLGGLILGGIETQRDGLLRRAPHLQALDWRPQPGLQSGLSFWADDTATAVARAPWQGAAGLVERALRQLERESAGVDVGLILAGGDASALSALLEIPLRIEPDLVLHGLLAAACEPAA
jgi:type III pantothenate kinase